MNEVRSFSALLHDWLAAYEAFFALLEDFPASERETPNLCGTWTARQVVAHLAGWHYEAIRRFAEFAAGDPLDRTYDVDTYNAIQVEAREHLSWDLTVEDLHDAVDILHMQARDLPEVIASHDSRYAEWIQSLLDDALHHQAQFEAWMARTE
jgi:hypothetical protein